MKGASRSGIVIVTWSLCNGARTENLVAVYVVERSVAALVNLSPETLMACTSPLRSSHERAGHH